MDQAEQVSAMIKALDKELTLADEQPVVRARNAYDALTETEKAMVENLDILTKAEEKISQMKENKEKADAVIRQIEAIGEPAGTCSGACEKTSGECRKEDHRAFGEERQDRCIFKLR